MKDVPAFFDGVEPEELKSLLGALPRRRFPVGSVLIAEGDSPREMYIAESGRADVLVADRHGHEHQVGRIVPGTAIGEMSLLTGQPAAGTVRAAEELEVLVLSRTELERVASRFPGIYRNVSAVLAERLAQTNRVSLHDLRGRLTVLKDSGGPPLLGYTLACSVAWHARSSTLLLVVGDDVPAELSALATLPPDQIAARTAPAQKGVHVMIAEPNGAFAPARLAETIDDLLTSFDSVLVQKRDAHGEDSTRTVLLADGAVDGARVPALLPADEEALREGLLPSGTPAGAALGRVAPGLAGLSGGVF
jgi:hypothetical protein